MRDKTRSRLLAMLLLLSMLLSLMPGAAFAEEPADIAAEEPEAVALLDGDAAEEAAEAEAPAEEAAEAEAEAPAEEPAEAEETVEEAPAVRDEEPAAAELPVQILPAAAETQAAAEYTVTYYSKNPDTGTFRRKLHAEDSSFSLGEVVFSRGVKYASDGSYCTKYTLAGWSEVDGGSIVYAPKETITMPGNDLALYAVWEESEQCYWEVYAEANGSLHYQPLKASPGSEEWLDAAAGQIVKVYVNDSRKVYRGTIHGFQPVPAEGYVFDGWYVYGEDKLTIETLKADDFPETLTNTILDAGRNKLVARFIEDTGDLSLITYQRDEAGTQVYYSQSVKNGSVTPTIPDPSYKNHYFLGWSPEVAETVNGDATYVAQWLEGPTAENTESPLFTLRCLNSPGVDGKEHEDMPYSASQFTAGDDIVWNSERGLYTCTLKLTGVGVAIGVGPGCYAVFSGQEHHLAAAGTPVVNVFWDAEKGLWVPDGEQIVEVEHDTGDEEIPASKLASISPVICVVDSSDSSIYKTLKLIEGSYEIEMLTPGENQRNAVVRITDLEAYAKALGAKYSVDWEKNIHSEDYYCFAMVRKLSIEKTAAGYEYYAWSDWNYDKSNTEFQSIGVYYNEFLNGKELQVKKDSSGIPAPAAITDAELAAASPIVCAVDVSNAESFRTIGFLPGSYQVGEMTELAEDCYSTTVSITDLAAYAAAFGEGFYVSQDNARAADSYSFVFVNSYDGTAWSGWQLDIAASDYTADEAASGKQLLVCDLYTVTYDCNLINRFGNQFIGGPLYDASAWQPFSVHYGDPVPALDDTAIQNMLLFMNEYQAFDGWDPEIHEGDVVTGNVTYVSTWVRLPDVDRYSPGGGSSAPSDADNVTGTFGILHCVTDEAHDAPFDGYHLMPLIESVSDWTREGDTWFCSINLCYNRYTWNNAPENGGFMPLLVQDGIVAPGHYPVTPIPNNKDVRASLRAVYDRETDTWSAVEPIVFDVYCGYKVVFRDEDGASDVFYVPEGGTLPAYEGNTERENCIFLGWYSGGVPVTPGDPDFIVTKDMYVTATFLELPDASGLCNVLGPMFRFACTAEIMELNHSPAITPDLLSAAGVQPVFDELQYENGVFSVNMLLSAEDISAVLAYCEDHVHEIGVSEDKISEFFLGEKHDLLFTDDLLIPLQFIEGSYGDIGPGSAGGSLESMSEVLYGYWGLEDESLAEEIPIRCRYLVFLFSADGEFLECWDFPRYYFDYDAGEYVEIPEEERDLSWLPRTEEELIAEFGEDALAVFCPEGCVFCGWYALDEEGNRFEVPEIVNADFSIYPDFREAGGAPVIVMEPVDARIPINRPVEFVVEAEGDDLHYQWFYRPNEDTAWKPSPADGSLTPTLSLKATLNRDGMQYYCLISNSAGSVESTVVTLTVIEKPVITVQPTDIYAAIGDTVHFTVEAEGKDLQYQWYFRPDEDTAWKKSPAVGNDTDTLELPATRGRNGMQYRCTITNPAGKEYTETVTLTVSEPVILKQPESVTAQLNETVNLTVEAVGGTLRYQWYFRRGENEAWYKSPAEGNTTATLTLLAENKRNGMQYRCAITNSVGTTYTEIVTLTVSGVLVIIEQPSDVTAALGESVSFHVEAQGAMSYQWYFRYNEGGKWYKSPAEGSTTDTLTVEATAKRNGMQYRCRMFDGSGKSFYTSVVTLTVTD